MKQLGYSIVILMLWTSGAASQQPAQPGAAPQFRGRVNREAHISVVDFGANGHDERWDTEAIQRAIDSLPRPTMPSGKDRAGGVVALPAGRYLINKPLRLTHGVTLRGEGAATILHAAADDPAILLFCPFGHKHVAFVVVEDLTIYTEKSTAITTDASAGNIVQCRFENLIISPAGAAIDLDPGDQRKTYTQNTVVRNIHVMRFGGPALRLFGNANHIDQINTEGGTRETFKAEPAIVTVSGAWNDIRNCIIEANTPNPAVAFHVSGPFTWEHNWVELDPVKDGVAYVFKDVDTGIIDFLHHILPHHRARFENCRAMQIRVLNLDGTDAGLAQNIELDDKSNVRIDQLLARTDSGMLDDPRMSIGSVVSKIGGQRTDFPLRAARARPLDDAASAARDANGWLARWEDGARGSTRIEDAPDGTRRLRVEIGENPRKRPIAVETTLELPEELLGKEAVVTWRVEGPGQHVVYLNDKEFPSRARGSLTANPTPMPLRKGDVLRFIFPPDAGTYYISGIAVHPK